MCVKSFFEARERVEDKMKPASLPKRQATLVIGLVTYSTGITTFLAGVVTMAIPVITADLHLPQNLVL
jgi:hypothetical protein